MGAKHLHDVSSQWTVIAVVLDRKYRRNARKSREWTKKWLLKRQDFSHVSLLKELRFHPKEWHNFLRMNESTYLTLISMVSPLIQRKKKLQCGKHCSVFNWNLHNLKIDILYGNNIGQCHKQHCHWTETYLNAENMYVVPTVDPQVQQYIVNVVLTLQSQVQYHNVNWWSVSVRCIDNLEFLVKIPSCASYNTSFINFSAIILCSLVNILNFEATFFQVISNISSFPKYCNLSLTRDSTA